MRAHCDPPFGQVGCPARPSHGRLPKFLAERFMLDAVPVHRLTCSGRLLQACIRQNVLYELERKRQSKINRNYRHPFFRPRCIAGRNPLLEQMKPMPPASYFRGARRVGREATFDPLRGAFIVLARPKDPEPNPQERRRGLGGSPWKDPGQVKALLVRGSRCTCSYTRIDFV